MVLLIHHDAQPVREKHGRSTSEWMLRVETRQLLAHEVPLVQQRSICRRQLIEPVKDGLAKLLHRREGLTHLRQHAQSLSVAGPGRKSVALDVPRKADPRRQHDVRVLARGVEPADASVRKQR